MTYKYDNVDVIMLKTAFINYNFYKRPYLEINNYH